MSSVVFVLVLDYSTKLPLLDCLVISCYRQSSVKPKTIVGGKIKLSTFKKYRVIFRWKARDGIMFVFLKSEMIMD